MPSIITDDMVKDLCSMSRPIPIGSMGFLSPNNKKGFTPNYIKRGRVGIKPVALPVYAPASVASLIKSTCELSKLDKEVVTEYVENQIAERNPVAADLGVDAIYDAVESFVNEELFAGKFQRDEGVEETKAEVDVDTTAPATPEGRGGGGGGATPDSINKKSRGRGLGGGGGGGAAEQLDYSEEGVAVETGGDITQLTSLRKTRKPRSDKGLLRGKQKRTLEKDNMVMEDKPRTRAAAAAEEEDENIKLRLRSADGEY